MTAWVTGHIKHRTVQFKCDHCKDCVDPYDPECTYPPTDCTRHELQNMAVCYGCDTMPCRCEEIDARRKYPWER